MHTISYQLKRVNKLFKENVMLNNIMSKNSIVILMLCLILLPAGAYAANSVLIIRVEVDENGRIITVIQDNEGNPLEECLICTAERERILKEKFKLTCKDAAQQGVEIDGKRICRSLISVTLRDVADIQLLTTTQHDLHFTTIEDGVVREKPVPHRH